MRRAVFLDRDGVLNEAVIREGKPYPPSNVADTVITAGAAQALARLKELGFLLLVVTNQPDVARGTTTREAVDAIHSFLVSQLPVDEFWTCFHDDRDHCECRKPAPGLLLDAAEKHGIDLGRSFLVGDRWRDIEAGNSAGCATVWIDRGYRERAATPSISVSSLPLAVDWIVSQVQRETEPFV
jgi:D-glycero-D-manno-heptose 1,7-bisphosphate phosphatase